MKRILMTALTAIVISLQFCYSQDILVKKDGTTIKTKIVEVGTNEIKYKKYSNLNGPTYSILISEILSVNYENGTVDNFQEKEEKQVQNNPVVVIQNGNSKIEYMHQQEMDNYYKQGRTLKIWSWIAMGVGGVSLLGSAAAALSGNEKTFESPLFWAPVIFGVGCVVSSFPLRTAGNNKIEIARRMSQASVPIQELRVGNTTMTPMLSVFNDKFTHKTSLGLSCNVNF